MHSMFVPLAFALAGTGIPVLGSEHIVPEHYRTRRFQYLLLILAAPFLEKLTVLSHSIRSRYPNGVRRRMLVMQNPVEAAVNVANVGLGKERFTLLSVGRLDEQKDHATLIRAFAQIAQEFPQWHLKIVGEGPLRSKLEDLVEALGLQARVMMPGVTSTIGAEYEAAEIFAISSRYEAFGLVTAEAMSHGLPVVGFADCPGTNELIQSGKTGLLVKPGEGRISSLASTLSSLMADPALRQHLGVAGKNAIDNQFSPKHVCDQWEILLKSLTRTG
jgi:glycosyltransferase involved in cell wall biosynthesis